MAGELYVSNLIGTFDYQEILSLYYKSQSLPVQLLQQSESVLLERESALKELKQEIDSLYDAFNSLTSTTVLESKRVSVSEPEVLQAEVVDPLKALEGSYQVNVSKLAKNDVWLSLAGVSELSQSVASTSGQITVKYGGEVVATVDYDVDVDDSTYPSTLTEVVNAINSVQDKVKASIIYDGSSYRLLLSGRDTGKDNLVEVEETGSGDLLDKLEIGASYSDSHVQTAQDAELEIFGAQITSSTNTFDGAVPGLRLTVSSLGSSTVTVEPDYEPLKEALNSLINAYNKVVDFINEKAGKDGILSGDNTVYTVRSAILSRLQPLFNLSLLEVDKDTGHVSVDATKLSELLSSSPQELEGAISKLKASLGDYLLFLISPDSPIENEIESLDKEKDRIEGRIDELNKSINEQMEIFKKQLIQVQLLQAKMEEIRAKLTATFGVPTLFSGEKK